jgi:hypothetical protein
MLQWDDDIIIDTSGELRSLRLVDGWHVHSLRGCGRYRAYVGFIERRKA